MSTVGAPAGYRIEPSRRVRGEGYEWDHEIRIAVPPGYDDSTGNYPVLWLTDGIDSFDFALRLLLLSAGLGEMLEGGVISAVGIVSGTARIAELLQVRKYPSLVLEVRMFPDATHGEVPRPALEWEFSR